MPAYHDTMPMRDLREWRISVIQPGDKGETTIRVAAGTWEHCWKELGKCHVASDADLRPVGISVIVEPLKA